jgi:peptidoglycan/LPS O-acetylase OafA/YrhL
MTFLVTHRLRDKTLVPAAVDVLSATPVRAGKMRRQIIALDLLRGLAALMVLLVHARGASFVEFGGLPEAQRTAAVAAFFAFTRLGQEAVMLFFVLSGFLVGGQIVRRVQAGTFDLRSYALDRCSRIWIPLVPACVLTAAIAAFVSGQPVRFSTVLGNMVGLNGTLVETLAGNAPLWSLAYEIWFYIAAGSVAYLVSKGPSIAVLLVLGAATLLFSHMTAAFLLYWCLGAAMVTFLTIRRPKALCFVGLLLTVVGAVLQELASTSKSFANVAYLPDGIALGLLCIGIAMLIP